MQFGKKIKTESYFDGQLKSTKTELSIPERVNDKAGVMTEVLKALEIIHNGDTDCMTITIERDKVTRAYRLVTKRYTVEGAKA